MDRNSKRISNFANRFCVFFLLKQYQRSNYKIERRFSLPLFNACINARTFIALACTFIYTVLSTFLVPLRYPNVTSTLPHRYCYDTLPLPYRYFTITKINVRFRIYIFLKRVLLCVNQRQKKFKSVLKLNLFFPQLSEICIIKRYKSFQKIINPKTHVNFGNGQVTVRYRKGNVELT